MIIDIVYLILSFRSTDVTAEKIGDFSVEIEHLESRLNNLNKFLNSNELKVKNDFYFFSFFLNKN
jgi:hypothetical protein